MTYRTRACNSVTAASCVQHSPLVATTSVGRHIMLGLGTGTRSGARLGVLAASVALVISMLPGATVLAAGETLTFSVQPGGAVSGAAFTVQPQVTLNTPASGGTVSLAIGAGSPSGTLVGCLVPTFAASPGIFTFSGCRIDQAGAGYVLVATWSLNGSVTHTSAAFTVSAGAFAKLQVLVPGETAAPGTTTGKTGTPSPQSLGSAFDVTVNAVDAQWNAVNSNDRVGITSSDPAATLPANAVLASGTRTFSVALNTLGSWTVTATDIDHGAMTANTSPAIAVNGAPAKLQLLVPGETAAPGTTTGKTGTPTAQTAGTPFTVTVNAVDANWNVVSSTNIVGITTSDPAATLPANAALVAGTRTFSVTLNTVGSRTVTATDITDSTRTASTSPAITVALGSAVKLGFTSQPGSSAINVPFTIQPVVAIQDAGGNTISTAAATTVTLTLGANPGAGTLTCQGGNTQTTSLGVATFSGCTINNAGVGYTLVASATGYTSATSTAFNVGAFGTTITLTTSAPTPALL